jgi:hypothetical protein
MAIGSHPHRRERALRFGWIEFGFQIKDGLFISSGYRDFPPPWFFRFRWRDLVVKLLKKVTFELLLGI